MSDLKITTPHLGINSPKKAFLKDFNIAFGEGDIPAIMKGVSEDITWDIHGDRRIEGKEAFGKFLEEMVQHQPSEVHIHHIITHGKEAAVNGEVVMADNKRYAFADIYEFTSAGSQVIKYMSSYVHELVF
ncbi:nuclear transport factor 2 family protein [Roseivirga sp. BDSF3-8]|uniref:nuclear transport factor 2 family protein n=1 Tax=Roseivirga sp. BDSF3-8 TaxID=3241598 RepID=UPI0035322C43